MGKRSRLGKSQGKVGIRQRLKAIGKGVLGTGLYLGGYAFMGHAFLSGRFRKITPEKQVEHLNTAIDLNKIVDKRLAEGWIHTERPWKGDIFKKGDLEVRVAPFNIHVRYLNAKLFDADYKTRLATAKDLARIMSDSSQLKKWEEKGKRWLG